MADSVRIDKITSSRRADKQPIYSDFLVNFNKHPNTGILSRNFDIAAVNRALRNLVFTNRGERFFNPLYGCDIRKILFEQFSPQTTSQLKSYIEDAINNYEPNRVNLLDVVVKPNEDKNLYSIAIIYEIINSEEPTTLTLTLYRTR